MPAATVASATVMCIIITLASSSSRLLPCPSRLTLPRLPHRRVSQVPVENPDILERLFPCILKGIPEEPK